jgi:hypothetical protein
VKELWEQAMLPYNLPLTVLLGMVVAYWVLTLLGGLGFDSGDADAGVDVGEAASLSGSMMRAVNAGAVPLTVVLSILVLALWTASILLNFYFNPNQSLIRAGVLLVPGLILAVLATKLITQPLVPVMRRLREAEDAAPVIGEVGIVRSLELDSRFGQVEVERPDGAPAILSARLDTDAEPVPRGTSVAVVSLDEISGIYLVRPLSISSPPASNPHP